MEVFKCSFKSHIPNVSGKMISYYSRAKCLQQPWGCREGWITGGGGRAGF